MECKRDVQNANHATAVVPMLWRQGRINTRFGAFMFDETYEMPISVSEVYISGNRSQEMVNGGEQG